MENVQNPGRKGKIWNLKLWKIKVFIEYLEQVEI